MPTPIAVRTNPAALAGFVLTEPLLSCYRTIEDELHRECEARYIDIHTRVGQRTYDDIAKEAAAEVEDHRPFRMFGDKFYRAIETNQRWAPWVVWACVYRLRPEFTLADAKAIVHQAEATGNGREDGDLTFNALWHACKVLFFPPPKNVAAAPVLPTAAAST